MVPLQTSWKKLAMVGKWVPPCYLETKASLTTLETWYSCRSKPITPHQQIKCFTNKSTTSWFFRNAETAAIFLALRLFFWIVFHDFLPFVLIFLMYTVTDFLFVVSCILLFFNVYFVLVILT